MELSKLFDLGSSEGPGFEVAELEAMALHAELWMGRDQGAPLSRLDRLRETFQILNPELQGTLRSLGPLNLALLALGLRFQGIVPV